MVRARTALLADVAAVLAFVLLGRRSHEEGSLVAGTVATALPFAAGAAAGELAVVVLRRPAASLGAGAVVLAGTLGLGMPLRRLAGGGTPVSFVVVATVFLALFLLGWRMLARVAAGRASRDRAAPRDAGPGTGAGGSAGAGARGEAGAGGEGGPRRGGAGPVAGR